MVKRRALVKNSLVLGAAGVAITVPSVSYAQAAQENRKYKILVAGGHPDDPETGCGGTIARFTAAGHKVSVLYLTTGEAGIPGTTPKQAATIRQAEAKAACKILGAKPIFAGQIDGSSFVNQDWYARMLKIVQDEAPDAIFTHWPVDAHRDHRHCSLLIYDAWHRSGKKAAFYYYEVVAGHQSMCFRPTDYVDITSVIQKKWQSCFVHRSQNIEPTYNQDHGPMEIFRGFECHAKYAEAFIHLDPSPRIVLP
jgi:LmbE family N-acetylglucosaminyl deacetylase